MVLYYVKLCLKTNIGGKKMNVIILIERSSHV